MTSKQTTRLSDLIAQSAGLEPAPSTPRRVEARALTGAVRPPHVIIAGSDKVGKSFAIASAAADPRVARVAVLEVGGDRGAMDEYLDVSSARLELIEHENTWADITAAIRAIVERPAPENDGYDILAIDGVTSLWKVLSREAHATTRDLGPGGWSAVNGAWDDMLRVLRHHRGPVLLTARADDGDDDGLGRVRTQRDLAYEADATVQASGYRTFHLARARSRFLEHLGPDALPVQFGDLNIPDLLDLLGGR